MEVSANSWQLEMEQQLRIFEKLYQEALVRFKKDPKKREAWMCNSTPETAALAVVANTMLNMDEFITKE